jgi:hypothetical protein
MVRIANGHLTLLTNAMVRLGVLLQEESAEGNSFRRMHDLPLFNASFPLFALTWTVMHQINEKSPLAGYDCERFAECDARLFLTIEARDMYSARVSMTCAFIPQTRSRSACTTQKRSRSTTKGDPLPISPA